jgi:hypothetical protein
MNNNKRRQGREMMTDEQINRKEKEQGRKVGRKYRYKRDKRK